MPRPLGRGIVISGNMEGQDGNRRTIDIIYIWLSFVPLSLFRSVWDIIGARQLISYRNSNIGRPPPLWACPTCAESVEGDRSYQTIRQSRPCIRTAVRYMMWICRVWLWCHFLRIIQNRGSFDGLATNDRMLCVGAGAT